MSRVCPMSKRQIPLHVPTDIQGDKIIKLCLTLSILEAIWALRLSLCRRMLMFELLANALPAHFSL